MNAESYIQSILYIFIGTYVAIFLALLTSGPYVKPIHMTKFGGLYQLCINFFKSTAMHTANYFKANVVVFVYLNCSVTKRTIVITYAKSGLDPTKLDRNEI